MTAHTIKDKTIFITGGGKNLGALIALDFAEHGAKAIALHYNSASSKGSAEATAAKLEAKGVKTVLLQGDLTDASAMTKFFDDAIAAIGKPDIAINTIGKVLKKPIAEISEHEYDAMTAVNSKAAFFFIKEAGRTLNDGGAILSIVTALLGAFTPFYSSYAGSKAPVEHYTRAASKELGDRNISVNAIGPGPMDTPFFYGQESKESVEYLKASASLSKFSRTGLTDIDDIVPYIRFIVSEGWWMSGQTILVNGGFTTK